MHFPTAFFATLLMAGAINASPVGTAAVSSAVAAPAASAAANNANSGGSHHIQFTAFDGAHCNREDHQHDFKLNTDGNCSKTPKITVRSLKVKKASRTWDCEVKFYKDDKCQDYIASMDDIETDDEKTCWAWKGEGEGSEIEMKSGRLHCGHPDDMHADDDDNDVHGEHDHGSDDN